MTQKLIFSNTKNTFETKLNQGQVNNTDIAFIKDSKQIWTHDTYFKCSGLNSNSNRIIAGVYIKELNGIV